MWPPSGSPARSAGSRLTSEPEERRPSVERPSVSGTASNARWPFEASTTVRQTPSIATESPTAACAAVSGAWTTSRTPPSPPSTASTRPSSRTIPVNTRATLRQPPSARASSVSRAIISRSPRPFPKPSRSSRTASACPGSSWSRSAASTSRCSSSSLTWRASQRERSVTRWSSRFADIGGQNRILTGPGHAQTAEVDGAGEVVEQVRAGAPEPGRDEDDQLVHEARLEERGREGRAALEQQRLDALHGQRAQLVLERARPKLEGRARGERPAAEREAARLARRVDPARVEAGGGGAYRAPADRDRGRARAELVHEPPALLAGDPAPVRDGDAAVEGRRGLVGDEGAAEPRPGQPALDQRPRLEALLDLHVDPGRPEPLGPAARVLARIRGADDDPCDPGREDRVDAGRRAAVVRAGLQRDVERRAARLLPRRLERPNLGVRLAGPLVPALADDLVAVGDDRTDDGVRVRREAAALGQLERPVEQGHRSCSSSRRYVRARSSRPKIDVPQTNSVAPSSCSLRMLSWSTPPSTWTWMLGGSSARSRRMRPYVSSSSGWPE